MNDDRKNCFAVGMNGSAARSIDAQTPSAGIEGSQTMNRDFANDAATAPEVSVPRPVFDRALLTQRLMGDEELVKTIIPVFVDDMPRHITDLASAIKTGETASVAALAHKIKGAAANVAGIQLQYVAKEMEDAARRVDVERLSLLMPELERCFNELKAAMEDEI